MSTEAERNRRWPRVAFRSGPLATELRARSSQSATEPELSEVARRDLGRYYAMLRTTRVDLTIDEWKLLYDVLNGTLFEPETLPYLWAEVQDALRLNPGLAEKWDVDGAMLVSKLQRMSPAEKLYVVDSVEKFWRSSRE